MEIRAQVEQMFDEIESYCGNFGDPIATNLSFDPLTVLRDPEIDDWLKCGASIGLLVKFCVAIDNSTFEQARQSSNYTDIEFALKHNLCSQYPLVVQAMFSASNSETMFYEMLRQVYIKHVKNWRLHGQNG